mmetsp:Transcript_121560/g.189828  ORF Transcript_121560/g.189828 Transcript_121560/m.189828 type:complete len:88 (-) Transcript_121560:170-433(-)
MHKFHSSCFEVSPIRYEKGAQHNRFMNDNLKHRCHPLRCSVMAFDASQLNPYNSSVSVPKILLPESSNTCFGAFERGAEEQCKKVNS